MILKITSRIARWGRLLFLPDFGCSRSHLSVRKNTVPFLVSIVIVLSAHIKNSYALELNSDVQVATAGYYQLSWTGKAKNFQLQESPSPDFNSFKVIYAGADRARVMSGKPDGEYFYRISGAGKSTPVMSQVIKVTVHHHPLKNAIMFFIAGLVVFLATLALIVNGKRQDS